MCRRGIGTRPFKSQDMMNTAQHVFGSTSGRTRRRRGAAHRWQLVFDGLTQSSSKIASTSPRTVITITGTRVVILSSKAPIHKQSHCQGVLSATRHHALDVREHLYVPQFMGGSRCGSAEQIHQEGVIDDSNHVPVSPSGRQTFESLS